MRTAPPKAAKGVMVQGEFGVYAGFIGQLATPGTYTVRIKADNMTDEGKIELIPDPLQPELDYAAKRKASDELYQLVEELGFLEAQVRNLKDSVDQKAALTADKKLQANLKQFSQKLDEQRKTLTETIESRGITGERQLRARIGELYVFAEFSDNMPTQSVMESSTLIRDELKTAQTQTDALFKKELLSLNSALQKAKMGTLKVIDKAEWERQHAGETGKAEPRPFWWKLK
jgi:hypothetical protein